MKDIGQAFKDKFDSFEELPGNGSWEAIDKQISSKINWVKVGGIATAIVAVVLLVIYVVMPLFSPKKESSPANTTDNSVQNTSISTEKGTQNAVYQNFEDLFVPQMAGKIQVPFLSGAQPASPLKEKPATVDTAKQHKKIELQKISEQQTSIETSPVELKSEPKQITEVKAAIPANTPVQVSSNSPAPKETPVAEQKNEPKSVKSQAIETTSSQTPSTDSKKETNSQSSTSNSDLYVPSAFTPGVAPNDIFKAQAVGVQNFEMQIFDKTGKRVFASKDINQGWTGDNASTGTYIYMVKCVNKEGQIMQKKGSVAVIRY